MKTARFYCENCGRAVPFDARMCPHCGKNFDAVKCPVCNYTGMPGEFLQGCPECGYLTPEQKEERDAALSRGGRIKGAADPIPARRDRGRNREIGLKMERFFFQKQKRQKSGLSIPWSIFSFLCCFSGPSYQCSSFSFSKARLCR